MARDNSTYSRSWVGTIGEVGKKPDPMVASNDALKRFNQAFPVTPNQPQDDVAPDPEGMTQAAHALMPPEYNPQTHIAAATAQPMPTINATPLQKMAPAPEMKPFVAAEALQPRGPVESAVGGNQSYAATAQAQPNARTELELIRAREQQDLQTRNDAMMRNANWGDAWLQRERAQGEARVANFRAANGADMVLRGGNPEQRQAIMQQAAVANANLAAANAAMNASSQPGPQRNYIQEAVQGGQLREQSLAGADARLTGTMNRQGQAIAQEQQQLKLQEQQRINEIGTQLAAAKTPEERESLQQKLLAMMGKDPREGWKAVPISMPDRTNEMGAVMKGGQAVALIDATGKVQIVQMNGAGPQQGAGTPTQIPIAAVEDLKKNPQLKAAFDAKYGAGAAAKYGVQ